MTTSMGSSSDSSDNVASCVEFMSDFESAFDLSGLRGLTLCLLLDGDSRILDASIDETLLCKFLKFAIASYGLRPFFVISAGNGSILLWGKNPGSIPPDGKLPIGGGPNGNKSAPGSGTGGVNGVVLPVNNKKTLIIL